jgi:hypothetical protein
MKYSLVYVHIGNDIPQYLYDNLYQTLLINNYATTIYVCINDNVIDMFNQEIDKFNLNIYTKEELFHFQNLIQVIPLSLLENKLKDNLYFTTYKNTIINKYPDTGQFRNEFWVSTTSRFFYIAALMKQFLLENVFHIENDVLVYTDLNKIYSQMTKLNITDKIAAVQDAKNRAICSFVYLPNATEAERYTQFIIECAKKQPGLNDMDVMGMYSHKTELPDSPSHPLASSLGVFDAAAIGQEGNRAQRCIMNITN